MVNPIAFTNAGKVFNWEKAFRLNHDQTSGAIFGSMAWDHFLPTTAHIHGYGCRLAAKINDKRKVGGELKKKNRHVYCGAYEVKAGLVRSLVGVEGLSDLASADVTHLIEDGEIAHAELRFKLSSEAMSIEGTKTAIVVSLLNGVSGPIKHLCECDRDITPHPSTMLTTGQLGEFVDRRSFLERLWHIGRFHLLRYLSPSH